MKSIVVADDHEFTAAGMTQALVGFGEFEVVGRATNGIEAIALVKRLQPDCAVFDLVMPGANGLEAFLEAKRWASETRFAVITGSAAPAVFMELVNAGIDGLFVKSAAPEAICMGIQQIVNGAKVISKEAQSIIDNAGANAGKNESLSAREIEVLHAISRGLSNAQIAEHLGVSPKTIDSHRTSLMKKMGVHSTATLLVRAMRSGLIDVGDRVT